MPGPAHRAAADDGRNANHGEAVQHAKAAEVGSVPGSGFF
jgi:hypothetical protein